MQKSRERLERTEYMERKKTEINTGQEVERQLTALMIHSDRQMALFDTHRHIGGGEMSLSVRSVCKTAVVGGYMQMSVFAIAAPDALVSLF